MFEVDSPSSAQRGECQPWWGPGMMGSWDYGWMYWFVLVKAIIVRYAVWFRQQ